MVVNPGENPFMLQIITADGTITNIELDEPGWATKYSDYLRVRSNWALAHREGRVPPLLMVVHEGEQPYYTARHFANTSAPGEAIAYGIGKKCVDGTMVRLWVFYPECVFCGGDDVDIVGRNMLHMR